MITWDMVCPKDSLRRAMHSITSEAKLLEASLAGNTEAFGAIVQRYQSLICAITYSATGDLGKSEELAQETFIRAWKSLRQLKDLAKFRAWLCTIARHLVSKSIKTGQRDVIGDAQPLENVAAVESAEPGPGEIAIGKEQEAVVWRALQQIPQKYREPMVLFYRKQQSVNQVATSLELSEDIVRQRLSRGRKMLKAEVATLVEETLSRTGPGKVFTIAVIAALPAVSAETTIAAAAGATAKGAPAVKAAFASGLAGAVLGPVMGVIGGLLGGLFGSWMSIKNTKSPRERKFAIKFTLFVWGEVILLLLTIGIFMALALKGIVPKKVFWVVFGSVMMAHFIFLVPAIVWANRRQRRIQIEDGTYVKPEYHPDKMPKAAIYGALGGSIFGSMCWLIVMSSITKDRLTALSALIFAILLFSISARMCLHAPTKFWRIIIADLIGIMLFNLAVVNLRWEKWMQFYLKSSSYNHLSDISLWGINFLLVVVFVGLLALFVHMSRKQKQLMKEQQKAAHTK
jgi:RNA polymerase sigma factor (sigma-70 family)